jgi:hypothetical protein
MRDYYDFSRGAKGKYVGKVDTDDVFHDIEEVIRHEPGDTPIGALHKTYGPDFARGVRDDTRLDTLRKLAGSESVSTFLYDSEFPPFIKACAPSPPPDLDQLLRSAIAQKRLVRLRYQNKERIIEPHDYGERKGVVTLLAYQVGGFSNGPLPNWRWLDVGGISDAQILDRTFAGGRPVPTGKHHLWDELYMRVESAA